MMNTLKKPCCAEGYPAHQDNIYIYIIHGDPLICVVIDFIETFLCRSLSRHFVHALGTFVSLVMKVQCCSSDSFN